MDYSMSHSDPFASLLFYFFPPWQMHAATLNAFNCEIKYHSSEALSEVQILAHTAGCAWGLKAFQIWCFGKSLGN